MEEFEFQGVWWLPEDPENEISGTLTYSPQSGTLLDLIGSFKDPANFRALGLLTRYPLILGVTTSGKEITLYRCSESEVNRTMGGMVVSKYRAVIAIVGCHFTRVEDITFKSMAVSYTHLEEWTGISGFTDKQSISRSGRLRRMSFTYVPPKPVRTQVSGMTFNIGMGFSSNPRRYRERHIEQRAYIELVSKPEIHIDRFGEFFDLIQQVLSLGMSEIAVPTQVIGKTKRSRWRIESRRILYNELFIYYALRPGTSVIEQLFAPQMLFTLSDLQDDLATHLEHWFTKAELLRPVRELYFGMQQNKNLYPDLRLLSYAQAVEGYYRQAETANRYVTEEQYEAVKQRIIQAIDPNLSGEFKQSLRGKMEYMNEYSLRKRMRLLLEKHEAALAMLITDDEHLCAEFVDDVVDTRNYLTHYDPKGEAKAKKDRELRVLVEQLRFLIEACLMFELGFSEEKIAAIMRRNQQYRWILYLRNEVIGTREATVKRFLEMLKNELSNLPLEMDAKRSLETHAEKIEARVQSAHLTRKFMSRHFAAMRRILSVSGVSSSLSHELLELMSRLPYWYGS